MDVLQAWVIHGEDLAKEAMLAGSGQVFTVGSVEVGRNSDGIHGRMVDCTLSAGDAGGDDPGGAVSHFGLCE